MTRWTRIAAFGGPPSERTVEQWEYRRGDHVLSCAVEILIGKPLDVLSLKGTSLDEVRRYADFLKQTARRLYAPDASLRRCDACPICDSAATSADALRIFGQSYARCGECGHGFVRDQPSLEALDTIFGESEAHAAVYIDRAGIETRLSQIIAPKAEWLLGQYHRRHGRLPVTALDVGAGGGHFVEGLRRRGIDAVGYERSRASRIFAEDAFGVALRPSSFLDDPPEPRDLVTMWGLLEYVPEPRRFLEQARRCLTAESGLLVIEVPRLDCFGTAVQRETPESIARHMDPTSHMNVFTDGSLATALVETGFRPVAAWYFGMDLYEFLVQAALRCARAEMLVQLADFIAPLQASLDHARLCDDLVVAAVPA
ncbi:MAG: class I SAM-dependent methyltransferase [Alphaproteobacteria bacterium]|nr:class I SAM-dependent methyltransferase [Alphaproteobacteria bacterium]